jgi:long-chain fatty acid transport protein
MTNIKLTTTVNSSPVHISIGLVIMALSTISSTVFAGGFQLSDHSVISLGRSHAGYGVVGDDASAVFFNPAGMVLLKETQLQNGLTFIFPNGAFTNTGSTGENKGPNNDGGKNTITPNFYYVKPINQQWRFGLGITAPFGTHSDYDDDFIGRYSGLETQLTVINANPSFSYKANDHIAIGFGISYQQLDTTLSAAASPLAPGSTLTIEGDSTAWGYNVGTMFSFDDDSRLGISYRSKVQHDIKGTANFTGVSAAADGVFAANADFTAPESAYIGYTKPLSEQWRLSLGYRWTRWSRFQELNVLFPDGVAAQNSRLVAQNHDSTTISIGADYILNKNWALRAGWAFDETPTPDSTRTVRTVDADRTWYSLGTTYHYSKQLQLDFAYRYISFENAPVNQNIPRTGGSLVGEYSDVEIHTLALQANYKF